MNLYGFVGNDGVNAVDYLGLVFGGSGLPPHFTDGSGGSAYYSERDNKIITDEEARIRDEIDALLRRIESDRQRPTTCCNSGEWNGLGTMFIAQVGVGYIRAWGRYTCVGDDRLFVNVTGNGAAFGGGGNLYMASVNFKSIKGIKYGKDLKARVMVDQATVVGVGFRAIGPASLGIGMETDANIIGGGGDTHSFYGGASIGAGSLSLGGTGSINTDGKKGVDEGWSLGVSLPVELLNSISVRISNVY